MFGNKEKLSGKELINMNNTTRKIVVLKSLNSPQIEQAIFIKMSILMLTAKFLHYM